MPQGRFASKIVEWLLFTYGINEVTLVCLVGSEL